ncbi:serine hydrolase [Microbacterium halophytorum]|uniref:serine hydrolase n=1 Tax=Microbacterium halophytorum TaxID=2067568 RepID=UPI000CFC1AAA|nr:serine hydrolase [Microbacterium halophytorum]
MAEFDVSFYLKDVVGQAIEPERAPQVFFRPVESMVVDNAMVPAVEGEAELVDAATGEYTVHLKGRPETEYKIAARWLSTTDDPERKAYAYAELPGVHKLFPGGTLSALIPSPTSITEDVLRSLGAALITRGAVPEGTHMDDMRGRQWAGNWRVGATIQGLPEWMLPLQNEATAEVVSAAPGLSEVQRVYVAGRPAAWREVVSSSAWGAWQMIVSSDIVSMPRGVLEADADTLVDEAHAGTYRIESGVARAGLPYAVPPSPAILKVDPTDHPGVVRQSYTESSGEWVRRGWLSTDGVTTFTGWRRLAWEDDVSPSAEAQALVDLAIADGWAAVYDPSNARTRDIIDGQVDRLRDALGNLPDAVAPSYARRPAFAPDGFGASDALDYMKAGGEHSLRTGPFAAAKEQPTFIMVVAQSRTGEMGTGNFAVDSSTADRNAIFVAGTGNQSWAYYAGHNRMARNSTQDTDMHVIGALFNGNTGSRFFIDGVAQYHDGSGGPDHPFTMPMSGLTIGGHSSGNAAYTWDGKIGAIAIFDGVPSAEVRQRMERLLTARSNPPGYQVDGLSSKAAIMREAGAVTFEKNVSEPIIPASLTKMLTAWLARQTITDARLDETVTVTTADGLTGSGTLPRLQDGDQITYRGLLELMMLPSHNAAARVMGRVVGEQIGTGMADFITAMNTQATSWGWEGAIFNDTSGLSFSNRATAEQLAELIERIDAEDPTLIDIMGQYTAQVEVTGPNARVLDAVHTIDPTARNLPEFRAGKTGGLTGSTQIVGNVAFVTSDGRTVVTLGANPINERYADARAVLDGAALVAGSASAMSTDLDMAMILADGSSYTRHELDSRYEPRGAGLTELDITDRFPGAVVGSPGGHISVTRSSDRVTLTIAGIELPEGADVTSGIPQGYTPTTFAYGDATPDHSTVKRCPIQVNPNGRIIVRGNTTGEVLRASVAWFTNANTASVA